MEYLLVVVECLLVVVECLLVVVECCWLLWNVCWSARLRCAGIVTDVIIFDRFSAILGGAVQRY